MAAATFDTLKFANTLKAAGVPSAQAEAQAVAFAEVIQLNFKDLVTKDDLARAVEDLRKETRDARKDARADTEVARKESKADSESARKESKADFESARKEAKSDLKEVEQRLTAKIDTVVVELRSSVTLLKWMIGVNTTAVLFTLGLVLRYFVFRGVP